MNNAVRKQEYFESSAYGANNDNSSERVMQTAVYYHTIALQAEEASHLPDNICGPDLGVFEEKYGLCDFV